MATIDDATILELCPFCGEPVRGEPGTADERNGSPAVTPRCGACLAFLDPLSRRVTHGHMGPWFVRDSTRPHFPGVSWDVMAGLIARGDVGRGTPVRGPGTGQFWVKASRAAGVAHLLGSCHACGADATRSDERCRSCGTIFPRGGDRDRLGLTASEQLSSFATNEELREGAPAAPVRHERAPSAPPSGDPRRDDAGLSPLEVTLGQEVAVERRKTGWLFVVVAALLVLNLALAVVVLLTRR